MEQTNRKARRRQFKAAMAAADEAAKVPTTYFGQKLQQAIEAKAGKQPAKQGINNQLK